MELGPEHAFKEVCVGLAYSQEAYELMIRAYMGQIKEHELFGDI